jgi:hypothetical protein
MPVLVDLLEVGTASHCLAKLTMSVTWGGAGRPRRNDTLAHVEDLYERHPEPVAEVAEVTEPG